MDNLWAPWRSDYILGRTEAAAGCIFCVKPARGPAGFADELILCATPRAFVMMNAYPYNNGHVMVAPRAHVARPGDLPAADHDELFRLVTAATRALERALHPDGVNLGVNLGRVAGAGVADHCHVHLVPRWNGDTNFMPVIGETKVISQHLRSSYEALLPHFAPLGGGEAASGVGAEAVHGS
jgi:ATP adenylyltransferase